MPTAQPLKQQQYLMQLRLVLSEPVCSKLVEVLYALLGLLICLGMDSSRIGCFGDCFNGSMRHVVAADILCQQRYMLARAASLSWAVNQLHSLSGIGHGMGRACW
jgi:hypothetical protein